MSKSILSSCSSYLLDWRFILFTIPTLILFIFFSFYISPTNTLFRSLSSLTGLPFHGGNENSTGALAGPRVAVCLVGGARRFELTGPSIVENILEQIPNSDLFLHSPLDDNAFKLSLLRGVPRIASVRIFVPEHINETQSALRVLDGGSAPRGIQGLLQYFNLVEGCLLLIQNYQKAKNLTYEWIVRTRVDGFWFGPLDPETFVPGQYTIPTGSAYSGLNDRLGIGDLNTSTVALSRLSVIPELDSAGLRQLNSERSFHVQFAARNVSVATKSFPFCVVTDRLFGFPPGRFGLPITAMSSRGPLNGAYCRPCAAACSGECADRSAAEMTRDLNWIGPGSGTFELCDPSGPWGPDWEERFDAVAGEKFAASGGESTG